MKYYQVLINSENQSEIPARVTFGRCVFGLSRGVFGSGRLFACGLGPDVVLTFCDA
jgi:hypothetical protein